MSPQKKIDSLVIAISSRALFDLSDSHRVFMEEGLESYHRYQVDREDKPLAPGDAFALAFLVPADHLSSSANKANEAK